MPAAVRPASSRGLRAGFFAGDFFASGSFGVGSSGFRDWRRWRVVGNRCLGEPVAMPQPLRISGRRVAQRVLRASVTSTDAPNRVLAASVCRTDARKH